MRSASLTLAVLFSLTARCTAQPPAPDISAARIKADVEQLSSDQFAGRGPGTRGEILTTDYLAAEFQKAGLKPLGPKGDYLQPVPLYRIVTSPKSTLQVLKGDITLDFQCEDDFAGRSQTQKELEDIDADAIFVGHGITAPEFGWDDYQGIDVKDKVVIAFTNEPPSDDPKFFAGKALTYYGRWTYRFEEAARRGAKACFIIHTKETAGYPYSVVRPLEGAQLKREANEPALAFAGWLSEDAGEKLLKLTGRSVDSALKEADTKGFKACPLGVRLKGHFPTTVRKFTSNNVVGICEGSGPRAGRGSPDPAPPAGRGSPDPAPGPTEGLRKLPETFGPANGGVGRPAPSADEVIVFTAHWDHLGVGRAVLGDTIYNGAADNATGCALLLELARAWCGQFPRPKRSAIFLAVTAEEKGLLGSKYYAQNPLVPLAKTALNLNFDMILPLGVPETVVVTGAERNTAWPMALAAAKKNNLAIETDQRAHLGIFYRSDHFSFARGGVPAFSIAPGMAIKGKTKEFSTKAYKDFNDNAYHSPQDEMNPAWDFSGFVTIARFTLDVAREVANSERLPAWNVGDEFARAPHRPDAR